MAKTAKNDSPLASTVTTAPQSGQSSTFTGTTATMIHKTKVPFKKVFSSSQLQPANDHNQHHHNRGKHGNQTNANRASITSITASFSLLNHNNQLSSSLPGMFNDVKLIDEPQQQTQQQQSADNCHGSSLLSSSQQQSNYRNNNNAKLNTESGFDSKSLGKNSKSVIKSKNNNQNSNSNRTIASNGIGLAGRKNNLIKNIPIGAIEPSLIGSLSSYLSELTHFNPDKFIKEIDLMLKYFDDAVKKDKLDLLNGSCNVLIETVSVNCSRLRDAYMHLQQVQLRLQILSNIHMNPDTGGSDNDNASGDNAVHSDQDDQQFWPDGSKM